MIGRPEVLPVAKSVLGEGPLWIPDEDQLVWVDIESGRIHLYAPGTGNYRSVAVGQRIGAVVKAEDGRMVCAMESGFAFLDLAGGGLEPIADPEAHLPGNRFNDGKVDPAGRFWAGTMPMDGGGAAGSLYRLDGDGSVARMVGEIGCSNGLGWSPDGRTMYYIDTPTRRIDRFDYDAISGNIGNRRTAAVIPREHGYPDGMTVDAEGMLWVACWDGYGVSRIDPATGKLLERLELPVARVTSCCFGGESLDELYITSASVGLSEEQLRREPLSGSLFMHKPGVKGLPATEYKAFGR
ncbi:SMP-30/gluconolactonase/LRE family protein [Paenibacillaceae bacterium WGS1546]|uniref:SMP-30/gluconolactonase/LRE family protein n=1 Tax=Cohnella sp. WGS1546 TaxID=3366810 RepID=UPI00372D77FF